MTKTFDYIVIGGGSAGVRSARIAAAHGARVALVEAKRLGGTCVNVGCVPKKLFTYAAQYAHDFTDAAGFGWRMQEPQFDWQTLLKNKDNEIKRLNGIYENLLQESGVTRIDGTASFTAPGTVAVAEGVYTAPHILIATGGTPRHPDFEGGDLCIVSDDAFYLERLPPSVAILGGGYIAVEFAHIFNSLGVEVTIIHRGPELLRYFDSDISQHIGREYKKQGMRVILNHNISRVERQEDGYAVVLENQEKIPAGLVFSALGRKPSVDALDLPRAGIALTKNGYIDTDDHFETSAPGIYAVGDVARPENNLTPIALAEGHHLADRLFGKGITPRAWNRDQIPTAIFSSPPIGAVGLTEHEARKREIPIRTYKSEFRPLRHTLSCRDTRTMMKMVVHAETNIVLGCHMVGDDAPEIIQGMAVALSAGATKADFDRTIGIHPTSAEEFVTMK